MYMKKRGRPKKDGVMIHRKIAADVIEGAEEVRAEGETLTDQIEDGLRRHIAARRRAKK
ncbi:hypothetical protein SAMN05660686_02505 [Thalassobaculum litoreum DSM 18839]|uniref:Uncharacterized protein n=1 Tax=Thalassobaculum litoreum DSM 18839 TaxID=1123362 RepID=A0A8G2BJJ5_9PROT|nr:hypothetical protein SAMN05660686_02505 [Thalassobaculum litoreum DSM 18839]